MCVICICEDRKLTSKEIHNCFSSNPDGVGAAWASEDFVFFQKGFMEVGDFIDFYKNLQSLPHIVHFRLASSGDISPKLTHPFLLGWRNPIRGRTKNGVLFHNGHYLPWRETLQQIAFYCLIKGKKFPDGIWSDTRALAVLIGILGTSYLNILDDGKFAIFTSKGIQTWGDFIEKKGIKFSNTSGFGHKVKLSWENQIKYLGYY